jgi:hypothetical protein
VFAGPHYAIPTTGGVRQDAVATRRSFENVMCVITGRDRIFYGDVDFTGLSLEGLDLDRYAPR